MHSPLAVRGCIRTCSHLSMWPALQQIHTFPHFCRLQQPPWPMDGEADGQVCTMCSSFIPSIMPRPVVGSRESESGGSQVDYVKYRRPSGGPDWAVSHCPCSAQSTSLWGFCVCMHVSLGLLKPRHPSMPSLVLALFQEARGQDCWRALKRWVVAGCRPELLALAANPAKGTLPPKPHSVTRVSSGCWKPCVDGRPSNEVRRIGQIVTEIGPNGRYMDWMEPPMRHWI